MRNYVFLNIREMLCLEVCPQPYLRTLKRQHVWHSISYQEEKDEMQEYYRLHFITEFITKKAKSGSDVCMPEEINRRPERWEALQKDLDRLEHWTIGNGIKLDKGKC